MARNNKKMTTKELALLAILTALTAILAMLGGFIKIAGVASISLTLIPVVIGAALVGKFGGAWLGLVSGVVFLLTPDAGFWLGLSFPGTVITVLIKAILAGFCAGLVYELLEKFNRFFAVLVAAVVCPVVNTGIFLLGCRVFFFDSVKSWAVEGGMPVFVYMITAFVGLNFLFELIANIILCPTIHRIISMRKK